MKTFLLIFSVLYAGIYCFGQEVEFCSSLNTSNEQRFQNAYGIGLQYQNDIGTKFKVGLGVHYNFDNANFDDIPYVDGNPNLIITDKISSSSRRFSIRLNIQGLLKNNEYVSLSLGPELSYNLVWGRDHIEETIGQISNRYVFSQDNALKKEIGIGLITKVEIKDFLDPKLSLFFTIRPELITDGIFAKDGNPVFSGVMAFTEFQIGLKYRFKR
jgi:hypothetical protein